MKQYRFGFIEADRDLILTALESHASALYETARERRRNGNGDADAIAARAERYQALALAIADGDCDLKEDV